MRNLLIIALLSALPALLSAKEIKVDYKDLSYTVKQNSKKFTYESSNLKKEYSIESCNKDQFELFWSQYRIHRDDLTSLNKVHKKNALTLKEDQKTSKIDPDGKLGVFLTKVPDQIIAFEINEKMKCKK